MILNKEKLRERFLHDSLPQRLGNIAATLGRISSSAELVSMQMLITLWEKAWEAASENKTQRTLLSVQAKQWSDRALELSGLL